MAHIVIVSASVGAGHDQAAAELRRRLVARGHRADQYDLVELLPPAAGAALADGYRRQLQYAPWAYQATLDLLDRRVPAALVAGATRVADQRIRRLVRPDTAAVVGTYPLASQALGRLRRTGRLDVPAITYLTDPYVHRTWIAAGVDVTLAPYPVAAVRAARLGATDVRLVGPAVAPAFRPATDPAEIRAARRTFRLPPTGPLALIVAGSLGLGRPERTATDVLTTGLATPVVACGRYRTLHQQLTAVPGLVSLDWVDDMPTLMRAVDLVVHNAGGLTSLEALATGLPTITYRPIAGHGRANAAALEAAGAIPWVRDRAQLRAVLARLDRRGTNGSGPDPAAPAGADPAEVIARVAAGSGGEPARGHLPTRRAPVRPRGPMWHPPQRPPTRSHSR